MGFNITREEKLAISDLAFSFVETTLDITLL